MKPIRIEFEIERETKNKVRYAEITGGDQDMVGTLYVSKDALGGSPYPEVLSVAIKDATSNREEGETA